MSQLGQLHNKGPDAGITLESLIQFSGLMMYKTAWFTKDGQNEGQNQKSPTRK